MRHAAWLTRRGVVWPRVAPKCSLTPSLHGHIDSLSFEEGEIRGWSFSLIRAGPTPILFLSGVILCQLFVLESQYLFCVSGIAVSFFAWSSSLISIKRGQQYLSLVVIKSHPRWIDSHQLFALESQYLFCVSGVAVSLLRQYFSQYLRSY